MTALRDQLEHLIDDLVSRGVRYEDAHREFEKRFIAHVLAKANGNWVTCDEMKAQCSELECEADQLNKVLKRIDRPFRKLICSKRGRGNRLVLDK